MLGSPQPETLWWCTECKKGATEQRHFLSRLHLFLLLSLSFFLSSEDGWHASSDASSGSLTYFRKYHRFLLIALLSSRPLRTSPTGPTNSLITSSPRSPFSHAHVVASLFNTKIKTTTIFNNVLDCKRNIAIKQSGKDSGEIRPQRNSTSKYMWFHRKKIVKKKLLYWHLQHLNILYGHHKT